MPVDHIFLNETLRYARPARPELEELDGFRNFFAATKAHSSMTRVQLERGINGVAAAAVAGNRRRPAVLIRSSPWKAGTSQTPWHDSFDLVRGRATYYGDHKPETIGALGSTDGNKLLEEVWALHRSTDVADRLTAPPLIVFRAEPWKDAHGAMRQKGAVEFLGVAVIEALAPVHDVDPDSGRTYPNYRADLRFLPLDGSPGVLDWSWINLRRSDIDTAECLDAAPQSWQDWVHGH